jgi:protein involved in polysaccharide export with SLBB domain
MMRKLFPLFIFLIFLSLDLFAQNAPQQKDPASQPKTTTAPYKIEKGDEIEIKSLHNPEINTTLVVRPDGKISLPLAPEIMAAGKTPEELAAELAEKYSTEYKQPEVAVIIKTFSGHRVFVGGEVRKPGTVTLAGPLTVMQAISQAEGFNDGAKISDVSVIRRGPTNEPTSMVVNLKKAMDGSDPKQDMELKPYDIIYVPRSRIANVKSFFQNVIRSAVPW